MIVEFFGCTGAGKTTLATGIARRLRTRHAGIRDHTSPGGSAFLSARNAVRTLASLPTILHQWGELYPLLAMGWNSTKGRAGSVGWRATRFCSLARRLGQNANWQMSKGNIHIVDEGIIGSLDLILGGTISPPPYLLRQTIELIPLPDIMIWVDAPIDSLVERTLTRDDSPRELRGMSESDVRDRLVCSSAMFREIAESARAADRLVRVWNPDHDGLTLESRIGGVIDVVSAQVGGAATNG